MSFYSAIHMTCVIMLVQFFMTYNSFRINSNWNLKIVLQESTAPTSLISRQRSLSLKQSSLQVSRYTVNVEKIVQSSVFFNISLKRFGRVTCMPTCNVMSHWIYILVLFRSFPLKLIIHMRNDVVRYKGFVLLSMSKDASIFLHVHQVI